MDLSDFHNRLRIMIGIDMSELVNAGVIRANEFERWYEFRDNPFHWLIRTDDESAAKLWVLIERRAVVRRSDDVRNPSGVAA